MPTTSRASPSISLTVEFPARSAAIRSATLSTWMARSRPFHPVRDYSRKPHLGRHGSGSPTSLTAACRRRHCRRHGRARDKALASMSSASPARSLSPAAARIFEPGCIGRLHADPSKGPQGVLKSQLLRTLGGPATTGSLPTACRTTLPRRMREPTSAGRWVIEMSEIAHLGVSEIETVKSPPSAASSTSFAPLTAVPIFS